MNQRFLFYVDTYDPNDPQQKLMHSAAVATGSQETRARRRLLEAAHNAGLMVRKIECTAHGPAVHPPYDQLDWEGVDPDAGL